jgi:primosomal protein N' (replication factor Y)
VTPLCTVIERSHPPRVAAEEKAWPPPGAAAVGAAASPGRPAPADHEAGLLQAGTTTWLRPLPGDEGGACIRAVLACLAAGRRAIVLVPEADPVPATAAAVLAAVGDRGVWFAGGDERERYRSWLRIASGSVDVVVGTRPAVFAPLRELGMVWVSREVHPGHREERAPYYHVRDIGRARARLEGAACVLSALSPAVETAVAVRAGAIRIARPARTAERAAAPLVETTAPQAEDRSPRLAAVLKTARTAVLIVSRTGYGVARICRECGEPARCAVCGGAIVVDGSVAACRTCGASGRCARCGATRFGIERGGVQRIAEWAAAAAPSAGVEVGTAEAVKDLGPRDVDLVGLLDPDRALARPGLHAGEQALAIWMEAAAWAGPRTRGGRVLAQTREPGHPAIQALVRWEPVPFLLAEAERRAAAGFAPGRHLFRVTAAGDPAAAETRLREAGAEPLLATPAADLTICLVAVEPSDSRDFRDRIVRLVADGVVRRVEADPNL